MNTAKIMRNDRAMRALTGMSGAEFAELLPTFVSAVAAERLAERPDRERRMGGGKIGALKTPADRLFAVLLYLKAYPTFDVLGFLTDRERTRACRSTHFLLKALERALGRRLALPERKIASVREFLEKFPEARDVFLDGTERPIQRPKDPKKRRKTYSGKKKRNTRKHVVLCDPGRRILLLSPSKSGRRHDKRLADKLGLPQAIPEAVCVWTDTGFQGVQAAHANTVMPAKAAKRRPLTAAQKEENRVVSAIRVTVEHAIGGMKRMRAASDTYRNRIPGTDDRLGLLSAGIWNFHLAQSA